MKHENSLTIRVEKTALDILKEQAQMDELSMNTLINRIILNQITNNELEKVAKEHEERLTAAIRHTLRNLINENTKALESIYITLKTLLEKETSSLTREEINSLYKIADQNYVDILLNTTPPLPRYNKLKKDTVADEEIR